MALHCGAAPFVKVFLKSIFGRVGGQIFFDHQRHLKDDGIIEVAQVKAGQLADLLKAVDQRVAVNEQTAARLRDVQVVLKKRWIVNSVSASRESMLSCLNTSRRNASQSVVGSW